MDLKSRCDAAVPGRSVVLRRHRSLAPRRAGIRPRTEASRAARATKASSAADRQLIGWRLRRLGGRLWVFDDAQPELLQLIRAQRGGCIEQRVVAGLRLREGDRLTRV